jgi:MFS family permease
MAMPIKKQMNFSLILSLILLILGLNFHPLILTLVGLTMAPFYPLSVAYISEVSGVHGRKFLTFAMAFQSLAVVSMHLGVGYLTDSMGLFYAFGVGIFALVLSLVCLNFHPKKLV